MKIKKRVSAASLILAVCLALVPGKAVASESINSVSIKVGLNIEAGDRLPDIQIDKTDGEAYVTSGGKQYKVIDAEWVTSTSKNMSSESSSII